MMAIIEGRKYYMKSWLKILITITSHFAGRLYGVRSHKYRRVVK